MADEDAVQVPAPPSDFSDAEQQAWRDGAVAMLRVVGSNCLTMAGAIEKGGDRGYDLPEDAEGDNSDECPECGGQLIDALGGPQCLDCGTTADSE